MTKARLAGGAFAVLLVLLACTAAYRILERRLAPATTPSAPSPAIAPAAAAGTAAGHRALLYGRVTTIDGATLEGRLRWGGDEEACWGDYFNGTKDVNPWVAHVPPDLLPRERRPIEILGFELARREREIDLSRHFMARFGDIARIEARGRDVRVTLKSGTVFDLDRFSASDFDDGLRVWDRRRGVVDLDSLRIRTVELRASDRPGGAPYPLHGTVQTPLGVFSGSLQWNRERGLATDALTGRTAGGPLRLRFDAIRAIARRSPDSARVTLLDGRELVLAGTADVGDGNRGLYVDDPRYGRVLIAWHALERVDLSRGGGGPAYDDFPPGSPLTGSVTTRSGRRLAGRLVYDLDESESTETLDAPWRGVDYTIPFGLIASIVAPAGEGDAAGPARVILHDGEQLRLERSGDLGTANAGVLIFVAGRRRAEYVPWGDVSRVDLDRPPAMHPAVGGR